MSGVTSSPSESVRSKMRVDCTSYVSRDNCLLCTSCTKRTHIQRPIPLEQFSFAPYVKPCRTHRPSACRRIRGVVFANVVRFSLFHCSSSALIGSGRPTSF